MTEGDDEPKLMLFGRNLVKIPCFRNSFLYGISGGLAVGLLTFLFTSRPKLASNVAMGSYVAITSTYFIYCRFEHMKMQRHIMKAQQHFRAAGTWASPNEVIDDDVEKEDA